MKSRAGREAERILERMIFSNQGWPPFVGAIAMQLIFGRNGTINLLLRDYTGISIPFMDGLNGVILVQSIHYFPFILINLSASLRNIDRSMEEAAQNLGS